MPVAKFRTRARIAERPVVLRSLHRHNSKPPSPPPMATAPISPPLSSPPCGFSAGRIPATRLPSSKPPAAISGFACRCRGRPGEDVGGDRGGWAAALRGAMQRVARTWSGIFGELGKEGDEERGEGEVGEWSWDRWRWHFDEVEEQDRLVSVLKVWFLAVCQIYFPVLGLFVGSVDYLRVGLRRRIWNYCCSNAIICYICW